MTPTYRPVPMSNADRSQSNNLHPRRPPAHRSVSLLHAGRNRSSRLSMQQSATDGDSSGESAESKPASKGHSPSSLQPHKDSSGESSNAERWFEQSNNRVRDVDGSLLDNDPPFFMRHSSSSEVSPDALQRVQQGQATDPARSLPLRAELLNLGEDCSSNDDFRGVIDDLTVENKKLKRRLKKYEKLHDSHLKNEKLFEVRIHGLPADKKHELEETLRTFATSLSNRSGAEFPANGYEGLLPTLRSGKAASSQTSLHNTDSAYASMSASGQGSSGVSASDVRVKNYAQYAKSRQQNIQSYLHDIPEGLLPQQNPSAMTEHAKKKLVVRRLEQIFAGRGPAKSPHDQALQQEDVSQTAARADRFAIEAQGQSARREGKREASVMLRETEDPLNIPSKMNIEQLTRPAKGDQKIADHDFATQSPPPDNSSPDQRPTRPLDLDPHRAQVPLDNMRYIRHLGFSPTNPAIEHNPEEGRGWVYLNLLVNMAQLHTYHVTIEFVRQAISNVSDKLQLSTDGRKVRWKGGATLTRTSSESGSASVHADSSNDVQSPRKKLRMSQPGFTRKSRSNGVQQPQRSSRSANPENSRFMYTPLFSHRDSTDSSEESSWEGEDDDTRSPALNAQSSAMTSSGVRTSYNQHKKQKKHDQDDGPIIFYNNARFCTDLSGDRDAAGNRNAPLYKLTNPLPLGKTLSATQLQESELRGPLYNAKDLPEPMDLGDNPIPESMELTFPHQSPPRSDMSGDSINPVDLEVTGIGGVWPADNFAIMVESRHAAVDQDEAPAVSLQNASKYVPNKFVNILRGSNPNRVVRGAVTKQTLASKTTIYPPSQLPPALCFMPFDDDEESSSDEGENEHMSITPDSNNGSPASAAPMPMEIPEADSDESEMGDDDDDDDDDSDDESDGSLDLLAAARQVDPEAIRLKEREYDANMAERLAEDIPAGSSAATAGGGSGFASPASGVDKAEYRRAMREARKPPGLIKNDTSGDSMDVQGMKDASDSEDEGMGDDMSVRS